MPDMKSRVGRVRFLGFLEGTSFLLLMFVAMPMKYFGGMEWATRWPGWIHGVLFIGYALAVWHAWLGKRLTFGKASAAFVGSLLPFGPFVIDRKLAEDEARETGGR